MDLRHRKLLNESAAVVVVVDPTIPILCQSFCDVEKNQDGFCPIKCFDICPATCFKPLLLIPPPPQLPPTPPPPPLPPTPPRPPPGDPHSGLPIFLTISLAILATTFFLFTCYTIYKFYTNWQNSPQGPSRRRQPEEDDGPDDFLDEDYGPVVDHPIWYIRTVGLQPSVISAIAIVKYKKGDGLIDGTDCSVCLSEFQEDETLRLLPKCNHAFHVPCIDTWLRSHTNCPMCRAGIVNSAARLPSQELVVQDSGPTEERISGSNMEVRRELSGNEPSELRIGIEDEGESRPPIGLKSDENLIGGLDGIQPVRRSVSMDSLSASMISSAIVNAYPGQSDGGSDKHCVEDKESRVGGVIAANRDGINQSLLRLVGSQTGSSSMKRSLSCSAKVFLSRHSSRNNRNPQ